MYPKVFKNLDKQKAVLSTNTDMCFPCSAFERSKRVQLLARLSTFAAWNASNNFCCSKIALVTELSRKMVVKKSRPLRNLKEC